MFDRFAAVYDEILSELDSPRVLLAVSGGVDSLTMAELFYRSGCEFAVANCNFHLRGEEGDADSALVRSWVQERSLKFHEADFDTVSYASDSGASIEMAARELRYRWFDILCLREGYSAVAVAHNANDNAETLLLNLLRGTGLKGLAGMARIGRNPYGKTKVIRPMLQFSRQEIEAYAVEQGIVWREDRTNADDTFKRNRLRLNVFPELSKINPSFLETFAKEMRLFSQAQAVLDDWTASQDVSRRDSKGKVTINIQKLKETGHRDYLLYRLLEPCGFSSSVISRIGEQPGTQFCSPSHILYVSSEEMTVVPIKCMDPVSVQIPGPGEYFIGAHKVTVISKPYSDDIPLKQPGGVTMFDASLLPFPFTIRSWYPGDWMRPLGLRGRKKLSDLFTDLKYGAVQKASALLIPLSGWHIGALVGERIDEKIKVTPSTEQVTFIKLD